MKKVLHTTSLSVLAAGLLSGTAMADQVILDDLIVDGSICVGQDCVNGESFGFDTLRLKENNLRIKAQDTSTSASFPSRDWQITFNDSSNGGANKFSIDDIDGGRTPFTIEAGAGSNSLYVDDGGRLGFGTATPVVELHVVDGDTPTMRLEQDGSSGFTAQTWDVAGNESNFFVRDVTNGSTLPFRIRPDAPSSSIDVAPDGDVGIGTASPDDRLDIEGSGSVAIRLTSTTAASGAVRMNYNANQDEFRISLEDADGTAELKLDNDGNMTLAGSLTTAVGNSCNVGCDRVFADDYARMTMEEHAQKMWSNSYLPNVGPTDEAGTINITDKVARMLNELEYAHIYIDELNGRIADLEAKVASAVE